MLTPWYSRILHEYTMSLLIGLLIISLNLSIIMKLVKGTNESSYQYGYQRGNDSWGDCTTPADDNGNKPDCIYPSDACVNPTIITVKNATTGYFDPFLDYNTMTNKTACISGYIDAWNHSCHSVTARKFSLNCPFQ